MMILPFDSHNHVHMGPSPPVQALMAPGSAATLCTAHSHDPCCDNNNNDKKAALSGMAIMSTHPRDYDQVLHLTKSLPEKFNGSVKVVSCFGVHPWFLHELDDNDWQLVAHDNSTDTSNKNNNIGSTPRPQWIQNLEHLISANPHAIVGEIGLDGFHFDPTTQELVSPMHRQVEAFRLQMELAARLGRPVSIHTVQCFGPLFDTLNQIKQNAKTVGISPKAALPPKLYFHAFGGKVGTIDQILSLCGKEPGKVYFGFAPIINFRSPKTADVIRKVGIDRLVLETDHEDASLVPGSMEQCIEYLASALDMEEQEVIERTTANAFDLYNLN